MTDSSSVSEALLQQTDRLQTLNEISRVLSGTLDPHTLYETIYRQIGRVMDTSQFFLALRSAEGTSLEIPYLREQGRLSLDLRVPSGESVTDLIIETGATLLFDTASDFEQYARTHGLPELIVGDDDSESGIFVPLNTGSRTIGALTVQSSRPHAYSRDDVQTLAVIASQAAVAIENARLYLRSQDSVRQMQALLRVAQLVNSSLDLQTVLDTILAGMREVVPSYFAAILLPDLSRGHLNVAAAVGPADQAEQTERLKRMEIPFGAGITGTVFDRGEPLIVQDVSRFPGYIDHGIKQVRSELAIPLKRGDAVIGVLDIEREEADAFSGDDLSLLSLFASQAAIALENARLFAAQQNRVFELQAIQSIVQQLTPLHDIPAIAQVINRELKTLIDYHSCRLFLLEGDQLVPLSLADFDPAGFRLRLGEGITGAIAVGGRSESIGNTLTDPRGTHVPGTPDRAESMIGAPLVAEGRVRGVITLSKLGINQFDDNAIRLLEIVAAQAAIALDRARLYEELRQEAVTDELTGLYNRRYLVERLGEEQSRALRNRHTLCAIMLDIDKFKQVNDRYGHDAGDRVLQELAGLIRREVRAEDIVARYGGEEFCVLVPEIPLPDAQHVAERLRAGIAGHRLPSGVGAKGVTVSVGLSLLEEEDGDAELLARADAAMYVVKRAGGNGLCIATAAGYFTPFAPPEQSSRLA